MTVLIGHPTGSPNAHHAVLAYRETGRLEAFCVSWVPSTATLALLRRVPSMGSLAERLARRRFAPLAGAPLVQGRWGEWLRLARRLAGADEERLAAAANEWLMDAMRRNVTDSRATAVHCFEDCALRPFEAARAASRACLYDMPTGYHAVWRRHRERLRRAYSDCLPASGGCVDDRGRLACKQREMDLADLVLVPCRFAEATIREEFPDKTIARVPYGVDDAFWCPAAVAPSRDKLRFVFAGQISLRKGIPALLEAWRKAALSNAELQLVGPWHLSDSVRVSLPASVRHRPPCAPAELRARYRAADVFVFPSYFEGFGLALTEAMACGLPVLASDASIAAEIVTPSSGRVTAAGDVDALVDGLRWFAAHRDDLAAMGAAARAQAQTLTWAQYRSRLSDAVAPYV